jgi:hypothetical protein
VRVYTKRQSVVCILIEFLQITKRYWYLMFALPLTSIAGAALLFTVEATTASPKLLGYQILLGVGTSPTKRFLLTNFYQFGIGKNLACCVLWQSSIFSRWFLSVDFRRGSSTCCARLKRTCLLFKQAEWADKPQEVSRASAILVRL